VLALIDDVSAATEPERLAHISLGQENPQMWMNAAPGCYLWKLCEAKVPVRLGWSSPTHPNRQTESLTQEE